MSNTNKENPVPSIELLKEVLYALNMIPNQRNVGKNGESSYDIASKVSKFLNGVETNKVQPKSASEIMREWGKEPKKCKCNRQRCRCNYTVPYGGRVDIG